MIKITLILVLSYGVYLILLLFASLNGKRWWFKLTQEISKVVDTFY